MKIGKTNNWYKTAEEIQIEKFPQVVQDVILPIRNKLSDIARAAEGVHTIGDFLGKEIAYKLLELQNTLQTIKTMTGKERPITEEACLNVLQKYRPALNKWMNQVKDFETQLEPLYELLRRTGIVSTVEPKQVQPVDTRIFI